MAYSEAGTLLAGSPISSIAFSPHNDFYAFGTIDELAFVYEAHFGGKGEKEYHRFEGHTLGVVDLAFNQGGNKLVVSSMDSRLRLWNIVEGTNFGTIDCQPLENWKVAFLEDQIVSAGEQGRCNLYSTSTCERVRDLHTEDAFSTSLCVSPDSRFVAVGSKTGAVFIFDSNNDFKQVSYKPHSKLVRGLSFSPDSERLVSCSDDETLACFELSANKVSLSLSGHSEGVNDVNYNAADGKMAVTASLDKTVKVWDLSAKKSIVTINFHSANVLAAKFSIDGKHILSGGESGILAIHSAK